MRSFKVFTVFSLIVVCTLDAYALPASSANEVVKENDSEAKGILDGVMANAPTTTAAPGLGNLPSIGQSVAAAGPMLIVGGFQAVIMKADPSLIQGMPGLSGLPPIPGRK